MKSISDSLLLDEPQPEPANPPIYPRLGSPRLWEPMHYCDGQPFELFARMREEAPVMWCDMGKKYAGFWSVTGYDAVREIELNTEVFSSQLGSINMLNPPRSEWRHARLIEASMNSLINLDPPIHTSARLQQNKFFIPRYVDTLREKVSRRIDELLDDLERNGPVVDFAKLFSERLPLYTLCEMLGVDEQDRPRIIRWMHYLEKSMAFTRRPIRTFFSEPTLPFRFAPAMSEMFDYGEQVMADRRRNPREDLLTAIAQSELEGEQYEGSFLDGSWLLIIFAGNDTTRNSLSGAMRLLTEFPDQRQLLLDDPSLLDNMVNEALRLVSPVIHMRRTATCDTEYLGQRIAKNEKMILWYGAANRDPRVFPQPDTMDILRPNVEKHVAFGHGPHRCLGSRVAQMQLRLAISKILERFPDIAWTGEQKVAPNSFVHAISQLKVNLYG